MSKTAFNFQSQKIGDQQGSLAWLTAIEMRPEEMWIIIVLEALTY